MRTVVFRQGESKTKIYFFSLEKGKEGGELPTGGE